MKTLIVCLMLALLLGACTSEPSDPEDSAPPPAYEDQVAAVQGSTPRPPLPFKCGVTRWPIKTFTDTDAGKVNGNPVMTTVADLSALTTPKSLPQAHRVGPVELTTYQITVNLVEMRLQPDGDVHLVVADQGDPKLTMIVELPDSRCLGKTPPGVRGEIERAREAFVKTEGIPNIYGYSRRLHGTATIRGVGFWDDAHQPGHIPTGTAKNRIELHPVLQIAFK